MLSGVMILAIATTAIRNIKSTSAFGWLSEFLYLSEVLYLVILFGFALRPRLVQLRALDHLSNLPLAFRE
jgi:hypothetical protein